MLKSLRLKNWRSLRDVEINFAPITVFIGANSSGKTNIIDALHFLRDSHNASIMLSVYRRGCGDKIRRVGTTIASPVTLEYSSKLPNHDTLRHRFELVFSENRFQFDFKRT